MTSSKKSIFIIIPVVIFVLIASFSALKKVSPLGAFWWGSVNTENNIAVHGYDPVSYFSGSPQEGKAKFSQTYQEVNYYFSTEKNLNTFKQSPADFIPQFGTFCAFAAGKGFTADTDPLAWAIIDSNLYLFADIDVKQQWLSGIAEGTKDKSHQNWADAI